MKNLPAYRKTMTAVIGALLTWGAVVVTSTPTSVTASEWLLAAGSLATALGVYGVANEPVDDDGGQTNVVGAVVLIILVLILCRIFGLL